MNIKEQKEYIESIKGHSDRELQELQTYYARKQYDFLKSINGIVYVYFMLTIIGFLLGLFIIFGK